MLITSLFTSIPFKPSKGHLPCTCTVLLDGGSAGEPVGDERTCRRKIFPENFRAFIFPGTFSFFGVVLDFFVFLREKCRKFAGNMSFIFPRYVGNMEISSEI